MSALATERLFFAIWPQVEQQRELEQLLKEVRPEVKGRQLPVSNLHITLNFLGSVNVDWREQIVAAARQVYADAFELEFNRLVFRKRQKMLWFEAVDCPKSLHELVDQLRIKMGELGFEQETRKFLVHMTLMRRVARCDVELLNQTFSHRWHVNEFALVRSQTFSTGAEYDILHRFPLQA